MPISSSVIPAGPGLGCGTFVLVRLQSRSCCRPDRHSYNIILLALLHLFISYLFVFFLCLVPLRIFKHTTSNTSYFFSWSVSFPCLVRVSLFCFQYYTRRAASSREGPLRLSDRTPRTLGRPLRALLCYPPRVSTPPYTLFCISSDPTMKTATTFVAGAVVASVAQAQVVQWDIERRHTAPNKITRRQGKTVTEVVSNEVLRGGYFATCQVGTPPQKLTLQLDTGSSDIWVPSSGASVCQQPGDGGCTFGSFDESKSSSFNVVGQNEFTISYVDGSSSKGDYVSDTFQIGGATVDNMTMGLGLRTDIPYGLVGVGYALNEAIVANTQKASSMYDNLPVLMQKQGLTNTNAYSLWLNDLDASTGNILFGGIDTEKYQGDLTRINIYKDSTSQAFTSFTVAMTSLQAVSSSGSDSLSSTAFPIPVVLDSGTTFSYLPTDLAEQVWREVGAVYYSEYQVPLLPCEMENSQGHFGFGFGGSGGPVINITMDELVMSLADGDPYTFPSGPNRGKAACQFGLQNVTGDTFLLGDTFLRSAYVVYDLENNEIALAPTDFNATGSNVVAFPSKGAQVPSATAAPNQAEVTQGGSMASPTYGASGGFEDDKSGASMLPPAFDWSKVAVMGLSMGFMLVGSGFFLL
ncbi:aspartic peptidase domain-containing protein [Hypoxylon sp. FL1284]|nr:aspartic peptidase domain-containing protein [Hypoxylon sp. FL1284]